MKADCLVIDVVDNHRRHGLVTAPSLFGARTVDAGGRELREVAREEKKADVAFSLPASSVPVAIEVERVEPALLAHPRLRGYLATEAWHHHPITTKQKEALHRRGLPTWPGMTRGQASWLLGQPTPRQEAFLRRRGAWEEGLTFEEASARIGAIKAAAAAGYY
jgi:hypothetical protein